MPQAFTITSPDYKMEPGSSNNLAKLTSRCAKSVPTQTPKLTAASDLHHMRTQLSSRSLQRPSTMSKAFAERCQRLQENISQHQSAVRALEPASHPAAGQPGSSNPIPEDKQQGLVKLRSLREICIYIHKQACMDPRK